MPNSLCLYACALAWYLVAGSDDCGSKSDCLDAGETGPSLLAIKTGHLGPDISRYIPTTWEGWASHEGCEFLGRVESDVVGKFHEFKKFPVDLKDTILKHSEETVQEFNDKYTGIRSKIDKIIALVSSKESQATGGNASNDSKVDFNVTKIEEPEPIQIDWGDDGWNDDEWDDVDDWGDWGDNDWGDDDWLLAQMDLKQTQQDVDLTALLKKFASNVLITFADKYKDKLNAYIESKMDKATERLRTVIHKVGDTMLGMAEDIRGQLHIFPDEAETKKKIIENLDKVEGNVKRLQRMYATFKSTVKQEFDKMLQTKIVELSSLLGVKNPYVEQVLKDLAGAAIKTGCQHAQEHIETAVSSIMGNANAILNFWHLRTEL